MRSRMLAAALSFATLWPLAACASDAKPRVRVAAAPVTITLTAPRTSRRLLLHLDDVRVAESQSAQLRLFVNAPNAKSATDAGFLQDLYLVPSGFPATQGQNFVIPLPASTKGSRRLAITLVPLERGDLTMKRPYVTVER